MLAREERNLTVVQLYHQAVTREVLVSEEVLQTMPLDGGGGWYGGGAGYWSGAAGGSGYVLTSSSYKPGGYLLGSQYYMTNAQTIAGNTSFTAPAGGTETGHSGNGYARITLVE
mgnify:CR=1 FL=1